MSTRYPLLQPPIVDLWPGEYAFTDFGHVSPGSMDNRVFDQDEFWVDASGTPHRLTDMTVEYRINVIMHCRENADYFYAHALLRWVIQVMGDLSLDREAGVRKAVEYMEAIDDMEPLEWVESTPLLHRLHALVDGAS